MKRSKEEKSFASYKVSKSPSLSCRGKGGQITVLEMGEKKKLGCGVVDRAEVSKDVKPEVLGAATICMRTCRLG